MRSPVHHTGHGRPGRRRASALVVGAVVAAALLAACGSGQGAGVSASGVVSVVAGENQYGDVAAQIGGRFVHVLSVESNPNTDPHTYEVSPSVAAAVTGAGLVIQNGLGYDTFLNRLESASPNSARLVVDVQSLLGLPGSDPNPHLWYAPTTMPAVAKAIGDDLAVLDPAHASAFLANVTRFDASLRPWTSAIASFKAAHDGTLAASTEPVANYLLGAMGIVNATPFSFQSDVMNGTDPTPQDVDRENGFFTKHTVKLFVYNAQVVDALTQSIRSNAQKAKIPAVAVYETMPTHGYHYQSWMVAETRAIADAVVHGTSTLTL